MVYWGLRNATKSAPSVGLGTCHSLRLLVVACGLSANKQADRLAPVPSCLDPRKRSQILGKTARLCRLGCDLDQSMVGFEKRIQEGLTIERPWWRPKSTNRVCSASRSVVRCLDPPGKSKVLT